MVRWSSSVMIIMMESNQIKHRADNDYCNSFIALNVHLLCDYEIYWPLCPNIPKGIISTISMCQVCVMPKDSGIVWFPFSNFQDTVLNAINLQNW